MGEDTPQVPMDSPAFMVAPLSMSDAMYQLWREGIAYAQRLLDDLDYDEFHKDHLMSPFPIGVCTFSLPFSFILHNMYVVTLKCGEYFRVWLVQLLVVLLILLAYLGQSIPMAHMGSLRNILWGVTLMSWVTPSIRAHELRIFFVFTLCIFFFAFLRLVLTSSYFQI